jgi:nucleotide-binding universal stress UspA family protein
MFKKVLVAIDLPEFFTGFSPLLACLPELKHWGIQSVVLMHSTHATLNKGPCSAMEEFCLAELEKHANNLRKSDIVVETVVRCSSDPGRDILLVASEVHADLILIGSRSQNLLSDIFLGSVARSVIRNTSLPVLLEWLEPSPNGLPDVSRNTCPNKLRKVLLATDFSRHANNAERLAEQLAEKSSRIDCLHVMTASQREAIPAWPVMAKAALKSIADGLRKNHIESIEILEDGIPSEAIPKEAIANGYSMIILGKHGQNWFKDMIIGSTAQHVCETSQLPVLMVP